MYDGDVLPLNLYFMLLRALVPRVYFADPAVSIVPATPGPMVAAFAQVLERVDNKMFRYMKVKKYLKKVIQDAFMFGTGVLKLGFGSQYSVAPRGPLTEAPISRTWGRVEYRSNILPNMPWVGRVFPGRFTVPTGCEDLDDAMWVAHEVERPVQDVKDDPRFKDTADLKSSRVQYLEGMSSSVGINKPIEMISLYEVRDRKFGRALVLGKDEDKKFLETDDPMQTMGGFPFFPLIFNSDDEVFWGVPDAGILEPQQLEMNDIRTQAMKHRRATIVKILAAVNAIDPTEADKLTDEHVKAVIFCNDIGGVKPLQTSTIPPELFKASEEVRSDVREQIGFSRNQMGELHPKSGAATATEASIVEMASELRVDERRDMVADLLEDMINAMHEIIFGFWQQEQIIDVVGPGGLIFWVKFSGAMLRRGAYDVMIDAEATKPVNRTQREMRAIQSYQLMKMNPLIDPVKLTKYLLREMHGVQYDDLMRGLPEGAGQVQPMDMNQYAQLMGNSYKVGLPMLPKGAEQGAEPKGGAE